MSKNPSLFPEISNKYFAPFVGKLTELLNGRKEEKLPFFKRYLREEYSVDLRWGASSINDSIVAADIVALESSTPLKSRGSITTANGEIPKVAIGFKRGEKLLQDLRLMRAKGTNEAAIVAKALDDVPRCVKGIEATNEIMFLQGLSTGMALIPVDDKNGVRAKFGYKDENIISATNKWSGASAKPIDDLRKIFDKADADGVTIEMVTISKKFLNHLRASDQGKEFCANFRGSVVVDKTILPLPSRQLLLEALADEFGAEFVVIESSVKVEKPDGTRETVKPYEEDRIVALPSKNIGRIVYGTLVEEDSKVDGVSYAKSGSYTLVSKYSQNDPYTEFTTAQALCLPVIDNASNIYVLKADK